MLLDELLIANNDRMYSVVLCKKWIMNGGIIERVYVNVWDDKLTRHNYNFSFHSHILRDSLLNIISAQNNHS
jgi:hypothetical protein